VMEKKMERRGLGRGLSALMADIQVEVDAGQGAARRPDLLVPVEKLMPNPNQPRRDFGPEALEDLAASIRQKGVIQPLIVRPMPDGDRYEIVAGGGGASGGGGRRSSRSYTKCR
jgi:chromosome segregation DNA-binding protein